jgi:hypothetical protein
MITGHNLACPARLAVVEENKIFDEVEETVVSQHTVEQHLGVNIASVCLVTALPLAKMLPLAGDRAVACAVAVADYQEGVVVEGVGDAVLVQIVGQVVVKAGADVPIDSLQLDKDQRQAIDEAHEVGAPVVVRHAYALDFQFAHCQKAVGSSSGTEIDHLRTSVACLASGVTPLHRHTLSDVAVVLAIVLHQRAGKIHTGKLLDDLLTGRLGQSGIEPSQRCPQVAYQHHLTLASAAKRAVRPEGLLVPGVDAVPAEHIVQILGKGVCWTRRSSLLISVIIVAPFYV